MARFNHTLLASTIGLFVAAAGFCAAPVVKAVKDGAGGVRLEWTGGTADFEVFRSDRPDAIEDPPNLLITVPVATHTDSTPPSDPVIFYSVRATGCDPDGIYVLDTPILIDCPWTFLFPYLLDMQYLEVSQSGAHIQAGPVPAGVAWTAPTSCPDGTVSGRDAIYLYIECAQFIGFDGIFSGPDTIVGTFNAGPPIAAPPLPTCSPACATIGSFPFTARR